MLNGIWKIAKIISKYFPPINSSRYKRLDNLFNENKTTTADSQNLISSYSLPISCSGLNCLAKISLIQYDIPLAKSHFTLVS